MHSNQTVIPKKLKLFTSVIKHQRVLLIHTVFLNVSFLNESGENLKTWEGEESNLADSLVGSMRRARNT